MLHIVIFILLPKQYYTSWCWQIKSLFTFVHSVKGRFYFMTAFKMNAKFWRYVKKHWSKVFMDHAFSTKYQIYVGQIWTSTLIKKCKSRTIVLVLIFWLRFGTTSIDIVYSNYLTETGTNRLEFLHFDYFT